MNSPDARPQLRQYRIVVEVIPHVWVGIGGIFDSRSELDQWLREHPVSGKRVRVQDRVVQPWADLPDRDGT